MPVPVVESALDVALYFVDRARHEDSYLQAQKLQRLLYFAQGIYAAQYHGRKLMPATFIAQEMGPVEPNVFRAFESGRPDMPIVPPPPEVANFLDVIWRRFGHLTIEQLNHAVRQHSIFRDAWQRAENEEIDFAEMGTFFAKKEEPKPMVRTADGRTVQKWIPPSVATRRTPQS